MPYPATNASTFGHNLLINLMPFSSWQAPLISPATANQQIKDNHAFLLVWE